MKTKAFFSQHITPPHICRLWVIVCVLLATHCNWAWARGYEFPVILPNEEGNYTYSVFKTATNNALTNATTFSTLYPNPTKDQLFLDYALDNEQQATISLFDLNGRIVKQDKLTGNGKLQWLVDTLPSGFYYYQIQQNNETIITNKVIIIK